MKIGLLDVDKGKTFPNLALMKISAYHKGRGDDVEWCIPVTHYDKVYVSKVFGDEYTTYTAKKFTAKTVTRTYPTKSSIFTPIMTFTPNLHKIPHTAF